MDALSATLVNSYPEGTSVADLLNNFFSITYSNVGTKEIKSTAVMPILQVAILHISQHTHAFSPILQKVYLCTKLRSHLTTHTTKMLYIIHMLWIRSTLIKANVLF